ncbi:MAG TPA: DUF4124 domain-containing protein [Steroidobacteraceae bacterium]|nr:DUF4124 domain-containing protein [Steroidobacteraceae bacterium]
MNRTMDCPRIERTRLRIGALALCGALALLPLAALAAPNGQDGSMRVYKWTDEQGIVHYGDSVPPQFSQDARDVLNGEGVKIGHVAGRVSAAQLSADTQAAQEAAERAQHDKFLLTTYASTNEIEQLRDERLDQIDGQIKASASYIDSLTLRLAALEERAQHFAPYSSSPNAQRMPDDLAEELVNTSNEARLQRSALEAKRQAQTDMRVQFEADIARFRELTAHVASNY